MKLVEPKEICQVTDSIPWVRCASGNVLDAIAYLAHTFGTASLLNMGHFCVSWIVPPNLVCYPYQTQESFQMIYFNLNLFEKGTSNKHILLALSSMFWLPFYVSCLHDGRTFSWCQPQCHTCHKGTSMCLRSAHPQCALLSRPYLC